MVKNLRDLRREWVLDAIRGPFCAVARLFFYFGSILAPFWSPPGSILGQFGDFPSFFVVLLPFLLSCFFFLFFGVCGWLGGLVLLVMLVLLVLSVVCSKKIAAQQPNNPTKKSIWPGGMREAIKFNDI